LVLNLFIVHNAYIHPGGEDVCVKREIDALSEAGCAVRSFIPRNVSGIQTALDAGGAPWGLAQEARIESILKSDPPDILHVHNLFPALSPRLFLEAKRKGIKTVLTLHNFRPLCLNGLFLTPAGEVCRRCAGGNFMPGVLRGCYRGSRIQSSGLATHLLISRAQDWYDAVDQYIAPSRFLKDQFVQNGFPENRIQVQGHFDPGSFPSQPAAAEPYALYLGRLSPEKGILWLMDAFDRPGIPNVKLVIAGSGPLEDKIRSRASKAVAFKGFTGGADKDSLLRRASVLVMASECFENFPLVVMEANRFGVPVLVPGEGGMAELIRPGVNGELYTRHDFDSFNSGLGRIRAGAMGQREQTLRYAEERFSKPGWVKQRLHQYESLRS